MAATTAQAVSVLSLVLFLCVCWPQSCAVSAESRSQQANSAGIRTAFTTKGISYMKEVGLPYLESQLMSLSIPDVSGSAHVVIGKIEYKLENIKLNKLDFGDTSLMTSAGKGLTLQASGISLKMSADWSYKLKSIFSVKDSGSVDASGSGLSLSVSVIVGADSKGHAEVSSTGCSFHISHLSVKFHGGASWLYNLFDDTIESKIKDQLNDKVCGAATKAINNAGNKALESLPVSVNIDGVSEINYALTEAPIFTSSYIISNIKGEIQSVSNPVTFPFSPSPLPVVTNVSLDKMVYAWMTDYVPNTAGVVYQQAGLMAYNITNDILPKHIPFHLNTKSLSGFIPELQKKYPNQDLKLALYAAKPPVVNVTPDGAALTLPANVDFYVLNNSSSSETLACTLGVLGNIVVTPMIEARDGKEYLKATADSISAELSLVHSNIGTFDVKKIQEVADTLSKAVIIPMLNKYGDKGLLLPVVDGLSLMSPTITLGQGYIMIAADFNYKPTFL